MAEFIDINAIFKKEVEVLLNELKDEQLKIFDAENMNATGGTRATFAVKMEQNRGILLGPEHLLQLERGRKPGKMPPVKELIKWVSAKGIAPGNEESAAWGIAINIKNKGTWRWQGRFKKPSGIISAVLKPSKIKEFLQEVGEDISTAANSQYLKTLKK